MALESATYIHDLSPSDPVHTDGLAQADSHLRLIKSVLQATFPNLTGPVTASPSDLNYSTGLSTIVAGLAALAGATFTGAINAPAIQKGGFELVPTGIVVMWSGASTAVPAGYHLCDGTNGTPNLLDKFIVGAGNTYAVGATGGALNPTGTTASAGSHNHTGVSGVQTSALPMTGSADTQGAHAHGGITQNHALVSSEIPPHTHVIQGLILSGNGGTATGTGNFNSGPFQITSGGNTDAGAGLGGGGHSHGITTDGAHSHNITVSFVPDHEHSISTDGAHTHTLTMDTRPPYYALAFIMKL